MVSLSSKDLYVELNVRPAARSWTRGGRNLGLGIVVEDMDGLLLPASHYFRDIACHTVGNVCECDFAYVVYTQYQGR